MPTILLVEDNHITTRLVRATLEPRGFEVLVAHTGQQALELARRRPDLVLQDLVLPDADGVDVARRLREQLSSPPVPILAFTGFVSNLEEGRCAAFGFDDVIVKPVEPSRLLRAIEAFLPTKGSNWGRFGAGLRVVLADDDPVQCKLTAFRLERVGFEVTSARDGFEALELARKVRPTIIVTDILMPGLDGFRVCVEARRDALLSHVPVILVTSSYVDEADRQLAHKAGAWDYVVRTPDLQDVVTAVKSALARRDAPIPAALEPDFDREHGGRLLRQLERQVSMSKGLSQRCALLAAELSVLSGISAPLARGESAEAAFGEVIAAALDAGGYSTGVLLVFGREVRIHGFGVPQAWERDQITSFFGELDALKERLGSAPVQLPSGEAALAATDGALASAGLSAALVVPVMTGDELTGALMLAWRSPQALERDRAAFAQGVAGQIAVGIALGRAFEERTAAETAARERAATLEAIMESIADGVVVADPSGHFTHWNRAAASILGMGPDAVDSSKWPATSGLYLPDRTTSFPEGDLPLLRALRGEAVDRVEMYVHHPGISDAKWLSVNARPLRVDGAERGAVAAFRDVTAERAAQGQLMVSDRMASIGMLAAGVAHEINNPLAAALANIEYAIREINARADAPARSEGPSELPDALADAREAIDRVRQIVKDLRIFSRTEEDRVTPVDVRPVMESALRMAWNEVRHRARLVRDYGDVPTVLANESRLGQVFLNLVVNAAQSIPDGNADANVIRITSSVDAAGLVVVEIQDTGCGMSPEILDRLFTPFFTTKPVGVGSGLGLSICHRIVTGLRGFITVDSEVGRGSVFRVHLPSTAVPATAATPAEGPGPRHAHRGRILAIDDDPMVIKALKRALGPDHEAVLLTSGAEALQLIEEGARFDVILCDLMMPDLTGMDVHARLASTAPEQAVRMIFLSGGAFSGRAREFLDRVGNLRIEKPFDSGSLRAIVNDRVSAIRGL